MLRGGVISDHTDLRTATAKTATEMVLVARVMVIAAQSTRKSALTEKCVSLNCSYTKNSTTTVFTRDEAGGLAQVAAPPTVVPLFFRLGHLVKL